jgi:hypothetical protein
MTLDDLMEVWRSQDASPLHGVNDTLLRLALRQDEAKLRAALRRQKWFNYIAMAGCAGLMALFLAQMINPYDDDVLSVWDYIVTVAGLAADLILWRRIYVDSRAQARHLQGFGESLRDQLNRQLVLIDPFVTFSWANRRNVAYLVLSFGLSAALGFSAARFNDKPYHEVWPVVQGAILYSLIAFGVVGWWLRRLVRRRLLPRKRRLEALLKEIDGL